MKIRQREIELEAQLAREKAVAEAQGKEADALAVQKMGEAEAEAIRLKLLAEAQGKAAAADALEKELLAQARGKEAEAKVIEVAGLAEAASIRERMAAEAAGLKAKLEAMQAMEGAAREHEEFRIQLAHDQKIRLAAIEAQTSVAAEQAKVLGEAFGTADIQIMGGDGQFLDKFVQAASVGKALDGFLTESPAAQGVLEAIKQRIAGADSSDDGDA